VSGGCLLHATAQFGQCRRRGNCDGEFPPQASIEFVEPIKHLGAQVGNLETLRTTPEPW